jgi:dTDP-4-dehydrorhamnose reductase
MKVLILGINGLIGSTVFNVLSENKLLDVHGTIRSELHRNFFAPKFSHKIHCNVDAISFDYFLMKLSLIQPDIIINCTGVTKHKKEGNDLYYSIELNALFPVKLSYLCELLKIKLIHISTDCVFSGARGFYTEDDISDATDIYGKTKSLGEFCHENTLILRTSTIGHELNTSHGLLNWFLSQQKSCYGYTNAIFSGFPTVVFAQIIMSYFLESKNLKGLINIAAKPISKYDLLKLISQIYKKDIDVVEDKSININRSLNATKFYSATGYEAPDWQELIELMYLYQHNKAQLNV